MEKLYDYNHLPEYWKICDDQPYTNKHSIHNWGGPLTRRAALAIYTVMFLCLLRVDEVLNIKMEHIVFEDRKVILTLPFRKTHQFGGKLLSFGGIIFIWQTSP
jgi:integrase